MHGLRMTTWTGIAVLFLMMAWPSMAQTPRDAPKRKPTVLDIERQRLMKLQENDTVKSAEHLCDILEDYGKRVGKLKRAQGDTTQLIRAYYLLMMDAQHVIKGMKAKGVHKVFRDRLLRMNDEAKIAMLYCVKLPKGELDRTLKNDFGKIMRSNRNFQMQVAVIECLARNRNHAMLTEMHALFNQKRLRIAVSIALSRAFVKINKPHESIPILIDKLEKEGKSKGRLRYELIAALQMLTGLENSVAPKSFSIFWEKNKDTFKPRDMKKATWLFNQEVDFGDVAEDEMKYYDIPIRAKNVVFIVDESGSMGAAGGVKYKTSDGKDVPGTRLDTAKKTLVRILDQLPDDYSFNIIFYSTEFSVFSPKQGMVRATRKNVSAAKRFITSRKQNGGTNTMSAVEVVLMNLALKADVGAIFLLTDGSPAGMMGTMAYARTPPLMNNGERMTYNTDQVLMKTYMNRTLNIRINTIGIGAGMTDYLKGIADSNDGQYKQAE